MEEFAPLSQCTQNYKKSLIFSTFRAKLAMFICIVKLNEFSALKFEMRKKYLYFGTITIVLLQCVQCEEIESFFRIPSKSEMPKVP